VKDHLAEVDSVRAALALTARGEAPLALVYRTDARVEPAVTIVATLPEDSHTPILYQAATVGPANPETTALLDLLKSPAGQAAFEQAGFIPLVAP
jgi:molybdate transport system substrate-binding protein